MPGCPSARGCCAYAPQSVVHTAQSRGAFASLIYTKPRCCSLSRVCVCVFVCECPRDSLTNYPPTAEEEEEDKKARAVEAAGSWWVACGGWQAADGAKETHCGACSSAQSTCSCQSECKEIRSTCWPWGSRRVGHCPLPANYQPGHWPLPFAAAHMWP